MVRGWVGRNYAGMKPLCIIFFLISFSCRAPGAMSLHCLSGFAYPTLSHGPGVLLPSGLGLPSTFSTSALVGL